tara:strand:- start:89 stop:352 length:264 start_codon:yes stop_codon:yes gene_type:complete
MDPQILENVDKIFKSLSEIENFKYSYNKLYMFLNKSKFMEEIEKMENKKNNTPYTIFINEQLDKGIPLKNVLDLWEKNKIKVKEAGI